MRANGDVYDMCAVLDGTLRMEPRRLVAARPYDAATLSALSTAAREGIADPLLVGSARTIRENLKSFGVSASGLEIVNAGEEALLERTASLLRDGEGDFIMKGMVGTGNFMHVLLDPRWGVRAEGILSHVGMHQIPGSKRIFLLSDAAINILPNFSRKIQIVRNAIQAARLIGVSRVRVAMLAAVEVVKLPAMTATLDAFLMRRYAETGAFGECAVEGPFALDNALDPQKADEKGIGGRVAGRANVLIVPNIETGNVIWKTITTLMRGLAAGVVAGARCPMVVPSRADDAGTKYHSIQFARLLLGEN
jgi:phosphate butyryltransferase